jgi:hypothetical protein
MASGASENQETSQFVMFSFWKGLELFSRYNAVATASTRESFCETLLELVEQCSSSASDHVLCAQAFFMVGSMFPDSIHLGHDECAALDMISASRNSRVKNISLKLIQGHPSSVAHSRIAYCKIMFS